MGDLCESDERPSKRIKHSGDEFSGVEVEDSSWEFREYLPHKLPLFDEHAVSSSQDTASAASLLQPPSGYEMSYMEIDQFTEPMTSFTSESTAQDTSPGLFIGSLEQIHPISDAVSRVATPAEHDSSQHVDLTSNFSAETSPLPSCSSNLPIVPYLRMLNSWRQRTPFDRLAMKSFEVRLQRPLRRPEDGQINGYVKLNWPRTSKTGSLHQHMPMAKHHYDNTPGIPTIATSPASAPVSRKPSFSVSASDSLPPLSLNTALLRRSSLNGMLDTSSTEVLRQLALSPGSTPGFIFESLSPGPQHTPPGFGFRTQSNAWGRKMDDFYIRNWCTGRTVLKGTNPWSLVVGRYMLDDLGVKAAVHSLVGVYIHDYIPNDALLKTVNNEFQTALARLKQLLKKLPRDISKLKTDKEKVILTLISILCMQDNILAERRLRNPHKPRWLDGFDFCETLLQMTDPGHRFWKPENIQIDQEWSSLAVIVGRGAVLSRTMMPLPHPETFDSVTESKRFGWLLSGLSEEQVDEIHGGCGLSRKLLHAISQVTWCSGRLYQTPESIVMPRTARILLKEISEMRQWSTEFGGCDAATARIAGPVIDWVRKQPRDYVLESKERMTAVTAEAWRIAALLYVQGRAMRLPRDDDAMRTSLEDLSLCIQMMPTEGTIFTAQAPLLPVFLLGLLAKEDKHREVAISWFDKVVDTPVRSSVEPLYRALERILKWSKGFLDSIEASQHHLPKLIGDRPPWWERLVKRIQKIEPEILCLT